MQSSIVTKLLALLTIISETRKPLTFSELVTKSGLNKSTIHRLLTICTEERLITFDEHRKVYFVGPKIFDLVRNAYSGYDIQAVALDEMMRLQSLFDGNVTIGLPNGMEVVYLRVLESRRSMGPIQRPGMREPIHCSASGKALLAFLPDKMIQSKLDGYEFEKFTDRTIDNSETFFEALQEVREQGYARNDREEYEHFMGISAPIFNYMCEPIAVINLWTVDSLHTFKDLTSWSGELRASADRVTNLIGGTAPDLATLRGK
ncbi:IclR family transcriptional regulator [Cognatishimia sp. 1_MG-2023]|uniref:IclR family transcriptional regulator n=1 Tax=Cognatishimia sp. 1_MG-2023 TaxID=3062642 RepID=UPI0026E227CD|nr:IclR family transcriptional regulator [Cognatishimia sp. 1_MG-2023]MDO6727682.1 IclR family transcriptional regulator [Cognatishimia sp. 1_MG-2023]